MVGLAIALSACTLLTKLDDLSGGDNTAAEDGSDGTVSDARGFDERVDRDGNGGASDAGGGVDSGSDAPCGHPGPTNGLVAYYAFEEGSGTTVHDCSDNHSDGTILQPAPNTWTMGAKGGALRVSAPNGCVDLGMPEALQPSTMSIAAWVNVRAYPAVSASGYVVGQTLNADGSGWRFGSIGDDAGSFGWLNTTAGTRYAVNAIGPAVGAWHHVAVTFAPNAAVSVFVDGLAKTIQTSVPAITFSAVSYRIGCRADGANVFDGLIDEVRIYDRVLSNAEIASLAAP